MGGKKYPKKPASDGSSGTRSSGTQQSSTSSSSGGQGQSEQSVGDVRRRMQQANIQQTQPQPQSRPQQAQGEARSQGGQQPRQQQAQRPQQGGQQPHVQGRGRGQRQDDGQQRQPQQQQQWPEPGQGRGRGQQQQQQQQKQQAQGQRPQSQAPNQQQPKADNRPEQGLTRAESTQSVQSEGARSTGSGGRGQQQQQKAQGQRPQGAMPKQQPKAAQGLSRAESTQSIQSEGARSTGSSGGRPPQRQEPPKLSMEGIEKLSVQYKGAGKNGRKLGMIETNYLRIMMDKLVENAYHYDVKIEPDKPKKLLTQVFLEFVRLNFPNENIAFDGTNNAYASRVLDTNNVIREVTIVHPETHRERKYTVAIMPAHDSQIPIKRAMTSYQRNQQSADPKRAMQAMEVILKSAFHQNHLQHGIAGGRSFFLPPVGRREDLGDFYELWLGLFQSMVLGDVPFLNVDVNHKAFPKRYASLVNLLQDLGVRDPRRTLGPRDPETEALRKHLAGLEICYNVPNSQGMIYKFMAIVDKPANVRFRLESGEEKSVLQYFNETNRQIQYPELNCIKMGSTIKSITVPMEFCSISDRQVINKKCTETQTRNIIRFAATSTNDRKRKIMDLVNQIRHNNSATIRGFGIGVDTTFTKVPARQLETPGIQYANGMQKPARGVWRFENMKFLMPQQATAWTILNTNYRTRPNELNELGNMLHRCSGQTGLQLAPFDQSRIINVSDRDQNGVSREMDKIAKEGKIRILFVVVPDGGPMYAKIKQTAEIQCGILTQCIKSFTVYKKRTDPSTISNILLKVNAKLNGTNHKLQASPIMNGSKCMLIGADVTHPSPDQTKIPSVVGVAASHDENGFCYNICWRLQGQRVEIIQDFKEIIKEHLRFFKDKNGYLPDKILYYRDGVSEGQFDQVMAIEKNAMYLACREIQQKYEQHVKITVVVVQKRHHTRFFPGETGVGKDDRKNNNVPAGTIVDTVITRPNENHFYLVSHQSIQGVAKPTKYCILLDEGNHSIDDLQGLTFNLCHLFSRCNRSVSYPAPTYYAHLAAYRGRVYIEGQNLNMNQLDRECRQREIRANIIKGHPMYFV